MKASKNISCQINNECDGLDSEKTRLIAKKNINLRLNVLYVLLMLFLLF